jgi:ABC-type dipeptide/oligopeptide/nickel transport system permease subunit
MTTAGENSVTPVGLGDRLEVVPPPDLPRGNEREGWRRLISQPLPLICLLIVAAYVVTGVLSFFPFFERHINEPLGAQKTFAPPALHQTWQDGTVTIAPSRWLGLDFQGRSVLWRVLYGCRIALTITVCASVIAISIGVVLGLLAGYFGGWIDDLIIWLYSTVSSVPWLLLVIAMAYVIQNAQSIHAAEAPTGWRAFFGETPTVIFALGFTDWVGLCRLLRGEVLKLRDQDFVIAARAMGLNNGRIMLRHILPNTFHIVIITFSINAVSYVQVEVVLAFLGLGITSKPSWGRMIDDSKLEMLRGIWWELAAATFAIFVLCLALNLLGDALRDALDPRLRGTK